MVFGSFRGAESRSRPGGTCSPGRQGDAVNLFQVVKQAVLKLLQGQQDAQLVVGPLALITGVLAIEDQGGGAAVLNGVEGIEDDAVSLGLGQAQLGRVGQGIESQDSLPGGDTDFFGLPLSVILVPQLASLRQVQGGAGHAGVVLAQLREFP